MVGGSGRDDGYPGLKSTNLFAALQSRRKSKGKKVKDGSSDPKPGKKEEPEQFWAPTQVTVKSWADCEEDDDDYYATSVPPPVNWGQEQRNGNSSAGDDQKESGSQGEESDGEEVEDYVEEEAEEEAEEEIPTVVPAHVDVVPEPTIAVPREPERQLSKKELKKKELEELDAVLAELGISKGLENGDSVKKVEGIKDDGALGNGHGDVSDEGKQGGASESKAGKKKKAKKEKLKDGPSLEVEETAQEAVTDEAETNGPPADPKEMLKRLAAAKKKKAGGGSDASAKAKLAAAEAAARNAKLAAAKKKEKSHYNQQPVR
eukprot:TRINITY_DN176_c0_g1_i1.p1 TRINITY_DN176_c0_g1~~TRINITY_DN176_c0_g1_i1.p1  ORF type:complete len:318 (+),score=132.74 TRINITY_DN176_c0_g1_i1:198-1151(+)